MMPAEKNHIKKFNKMTKTQRVPEVLWKLFQNRARPLAQTLLSLIPPPMPTLQCSCKATPLCLRCRPEADRMQFLLRDDDPSDYCYLLNHCFVVLSDTAPPPPPYDHRSHWPQTEIVGRTIEMMLSDTKNVICTGYNKRKRSSPVFEALTSSSWSLLLKRIGDVLMVYLLKYTSIFVPLNRKKHHQVAGFAIADLCWQHLKHVSESKNHQPSSGVLMDIDFPKSSVTCHGDSTIDANLSQRTQESGVLPVAQSRKRSSSRPCRRKRKRRKLSNQYTRETESFLPEENVTSFPDIEMKSLCSCCSVWQTLQKVPTQIQINKRPMLYKLERTSSILPEKHILNSLRPNFSGANALFKHIFGLSDLSLAVQPTQCSHSNGTCVIRTTQCLYHSLHKLLSSLIRKARHCPRVKILNKHILDQISSEGESSTSEVVSFIWAACMNIVPRKLIGNWRILRKNISKFIRQRLYEKISLHQCMHKLKLSDFLFLSDHNSPCNSSTNRNLLERWIYWLFASFVVPMLQANFYVTESEHGKLQVHFYEKSIWEKLTKTSIAHLKDGCYSLVNVTYVKEIVNSRRFGFSRVRFRPKANGMRPLANLKSPSRLKFSHGVKYFKAVNVVLQDLHAALKDVQIKYPEKLGSSVFSYNDVHRNLRNFLSRVKNGSNTLPPVYIVVADVQKAYDSINQDKLLDVMKDVIANDHLLHQTHQIIASNQHFHVFPCINLSKQFRCHVQNRSSHTIVYQGRSRIAKKDDLHFNLKQHVKNNLLLIDKKFYQQNVGIAQGSILSSLLCSFYLGHMENTKLVPFLDKVASKSDQCDLMLLRFIDDFMFISTSKKLALGFFSRLQRGFREYNCYMNQEKFGLSFDIDKIMSQSNRSYFGNKFLRWSGLLINCRTLEVQADYTRYLDSHLRSTLTVCWQRNPGQHFRRKMCDYLRPKCHAILYDSNINSPAVVRLNIHQAFLLCAMKFHCYVCDLSDICTFDSGTYLDIIHNSLRYMFRLMKRRVYSLHDDPSLRPILKVKRKEVEWLGLTAYIQVLKRKQSRYSDLLYLLELLKVKSGNIESPDLKFAVDKSNSSVLWKIKY